MERNLRKERIGVVVSNKMDKTIIVAVETKKEHPLYGKFIKQTTKFVAQDDKNECSEGDTRAHYGNPSSQQDQEVEIS